MDTETLHSEYEKATQLYSAGAYTESLTVLDSLIERFPDNAVLLHARVLCLIKQNRLSEAADTCNRLIKLSPTARSVGVKLLADIAVRVADGELEPARLVGAAPASAPDSLPAEDSFSSEAASDLIEGNVTLCGPAETNPEAQSENETDHLTIEDSTLIHESEEEELEAESSEDEIQLLETPLELAEDSSSSDDGILPAEVVEVTSQSRTHRRLSRWLVLPLVALAVITGLFFYYRSPEITTPPSMPEKDIVSEGPALDVAPVPSAQPPTEVTLSFPDDRVLGILFVKEDMGSAGASWKYRGTALGSLTVTPDSELRIDIEECHWLDLDTLASTCGKQLQSLLIQNSALTDDMMSAFERLVNLKVLELKHTFQLTDLGLQHLAALKNLERLTLEGIDLATPKGFEFLSELSSLKALNVEHTSFSDLSLPFLSNLSFLEELRLPSGITESALEVLSSLPSLHQLSLGGTTCAGSMDFLPSLKSLEVLECRSGITEPGFDSVAKVAKLRTLILNGSAGLLGLDRLNTCRCLEELRIDEGRIDKAFLESLAAINTLRRLDLDISEVAASPPEISDSFSKMVSLKELVLRGRCPDRETLRSFLSSPNTSVLTLVGGVATDMALEEIKQLTSIGSLRLEQGFITIDALNALAGVGGFKELYLVDTRVTGADLATLSSGISGIKIITEGNPYQERCVLFPLSPTEARVYEAPHVSLEATEWRLLGLARGPVRLPAGNVLLLMANSEGVPDFSRIRDLKPDDLDALVVANDLLQDNDLLLVSLLTGLRSLTIISSKVGDGGVPYLTKLHNLRYLILNHVGISDASVALIADSMANLEALSLSGCKQITDAGAQHVTALKKLQLLDLTGTSVSPELIDRIRAALPECRILCDSPAVSQPSTE